MESPFDKASVIEKTRAGFAELEALIVPLSETQMLKTGAGGGWSVKDNLAHVAFWQRRLAGLLAAARDRGAPELAPGLSESDLDRINHDAYLASREQALSEVLTDLRTLFEKVLGLLNALSDDQLTNPKHVSWTRGSPLADDVAGDTYEHYPEHAAAIRAILSG